MPSYDDKMRRQAKRSGREHGAWLYVPAEELAKAECGEGEPVYYRVWGQPRGGLLVRLYRAR